MFPKHRFLTSSIFHTVEMNNYLNQTVEISVYGKWPREREHHSLQFQFNLQCCLPLNWRKNWLFYRDREQKCNSESSSISPHHSFLHLLINYDGPFPQTPKRIQNQMGRKGRWNLKGNPIPTRILENPHEAATNMFLFSLSLSLFVPTVRRL